ncbi:MAG: type I secretion system permease/ATPase [Sphingomonas sp.]
MPDPAELGVLRGALAGCRRHFAAAAWFSALVNLLYIAPTLYMLQVYDRVVPTRGVQTLFFLTLVLLFALVTLALLDRIRARLLVRAGVALDTTLAPLLLDATLGRPELPISRQALRDFDALRAMLSGPAIIALFDAPWTPIYVLLCFLVHPWLGLVALFASSLLPFIAWRNERATRRKLDQAQAVAVQSYAGQDAILGSADAVRALGMRRAMVARQLRQRHAALRLQTEASFAAGGYLTTTKFARLALQSLALGLGALLAIDDKISGGAIFAAAFLITRSLAPIEMLIGTWRSIIQARTNYHNLESLLDGTLSGIQPTQLPDPKGALRVEGVTVFNDTRDGAIVGGVSFRVEPGEVVAIVGPSGAGKSTLIRVIAGALLADRGTVRIDGADVRDWDPERLATHIGYLPQDSALFAGTVKENICRFALELDTDIAAIDEAVVAAAAKVGAEDLIKRLSNGYDHQLQLGGRGISAGQAQRITLARAVYGNPALLLLDEPNAHLDAAGDSGLIAAMTRLKAERRTILIVSHKLSILPVVDKMLVLRDGRMELFGPRDEILPKIRPANVRQVPRAAVGGAG